jgi:phosphatidylinositol kinase/protein kinase (PI-3  family)
MPGGPPELKGIALPGAQVLREHRETLVSVMETFVHDPLCEWTKRERSAADDADNPQARDALATLEGAPDLAPPACAFTPAMWLMPTSGSMPHDQSLSLYRNAKHGHNGAAGVHTDSMSRQKNVACMRGLGHAGLDGTSAHAARAGRLTGTLVGVRSIPSLPLTCEGQAHRLIAEATDKENLGKMYIWWMPWF